MCCGIIHAFEQIGDEKVEFKIKSQELDTEDKSLVAVLRLLCSLEYSIASMSWYAGPIADKQELQPHESILALALAISSTAEALHGFHDLVGKKIIVRNTEWPSYALEDFDFLLSDEVREFKKRHLKLIRDKSAFHIDPQPVIEYIKRKKLASDSILSIWEVEAEGKGGGGHSPLAAEIIGAYLVDATFSTENSAKMFSQIFGALRGVVSQYITDKFDINADEAK